MIFDIANSFHNIIQSFVKVVMNTKHNMKMASPLLEESVVHLRIMADALMPDSNYPLSTDDIMDVDIALTHISHGIQSLLGNYESYQYQKTPLLVKVVEIFFKG